MNQHSGVTS